MDFGHWLAERRREAGLTQRELARKSRLSPGYLALLEAGDADPPPLPTCKRLTQALGLAWESTRQLCVGFRLQAWLRDEGFAKISKEEIDQIARRIDASKRY